MAVLLSHPNPAIVKETLSYDPKYSSIGTQTMLDRTEVRTRKHTIKYGIGTGCYRAVRSSEPVMAVLQHRGHYRLC